MDKFYQTLQVLQGGGYASPELFRLDMASEAGFAASPDQMNDWNDGVIDDSEENYHSWDLL